MDIFYPKSRAFTPFYGPNSVRENHKGDCAVYKIKYCEDFGLSDIHANYEALLSIDKYVRECDYILCLGDIVGYSCAVNECIDYVRKHNFLCIQGNHERYVIEGMDGQKKFSMSLYDLELIMRFV